MKHPSYIYDWKNKKSFPYRGLDDPKYIKDRNELFKQNGNGWWWYHSQMTRENIKSMWG